MSTADPPDTDPAPQDVAEPGALPDLVHAEDLAGFRGAPFPAAAVAAAGAAIREHCHWHIAPVITETMLLDSRGGDMLLLRSLRVRDVVRVYDRVTGRDLHAWEWSEAGALQLAGGASWPRGLRRVAVELSHGHEGTPPELVAYAAHLAKNLGNPDAPDSITVGGVSRRWSHRSVERLSAGFRHVVDRYRIATT